MCYDSVCQISDWPQRTLVLVVSHISHTLAFHLLPLVFYSLIRDVVAVVPTVIGTVLFFKVLLLLSLILWRASICEGH